MMHLNVSDVANWYEERYPGIPLWGIVPGVCYYCFTEIAVNDRVITRTFVTEGVNCTASLEGVVTEIFSDRENEKLYQVQLDGGASQLLPRAAFKKKPDKPAGAKD